MGYYFGQFYIDKRDLFIVLAMVLLLLGYWFQYPLPLFDYQSLLVLTLIFLLAKGFLLSSYDSALFITFLAAMLLTMFFPLFQVLIFLFFSFVFLRLFRVI